MRLVFDLKFKSQAFLWIWAAIILTGAVGCSPGSFFGGDQDKALLQTTRVRPGNCQGLDLSSSRLDSKGLRILLDCLNTDGSILPVVRLSERLSDSELQPLLRIFNEEVLNRPERLATLDQTFQDMDHRKILAPVLKNFGRILDNQEFFLALGQILLEAQQGIHGERWQQLLNGLAPDTDTGALAPLLEAGITLTSSQSFVEIERAWQAAGEHERRKNSEIFVDFLQSLLTSELGERTISDGLSEIKSGAVFQLLDQELGRSPLELRSRVSQVELLLHILASEKGLFQNLVSFGGLLNRPLPCAKGAEVFENELAFAVQDIATQVTDGHANDFVGRRYPLTLAALEPYCEFPAGFWNGYQNFFNLIDFDAAEPLAHLIRSLYGLKPEGHNLLLMLSEKWFSAAESNQYLWPILNSIDRNVGWGNYLLLPQVLEEPHREALRSKADLLLSLEKDWLDGLRNVSRDTWLKLFYSMEYWEQGSDPIINPFLRSLREGLMSSRAHPWLELIRLSMVHEMTRDPFYVGLKKIIEAPEFKESLKLLSTMSKDDRLRDLILSGFSILEEALRDRRTSPIESLNIPQTLFSGHHQLGGSEFQWIRGRSSSAQSTACRTHLEDPERWMACLKSAVPSQDLGDALTYIDTAKDTVTRRSIFSLLAERLGELRMRFDQPLWSDLLGHMENGFRNQSIWKAIEAVSFWTGATGSLKTEPISKLLSELSVPLGPQSDALNEIETAAANALIEPSLPETLQAQYRLALDSTAPAENHQNPRPVLLSPEESARVRRWIKNFECDRPGMTGTGWENAREKQMIDDYLNAVTNWDLVKGQPRRKWANEEFKEWMKPLVDKLSTASESRPEKSLQQSMVQILHYFTLPEGEKRNLFQHESPASLARWFQDRSDDYRLITYFYPGEEQPRVRLVNTLDRMELVLLNADVTYLLPYNLALKFMGMIAEAWGDEPSELWPIEIRKQYPKESKKRPLTLREVYRAILKQQELLEETAGTPSPPTCSQETDPDHAGDGVIPDGQGGGPLGWAVPLRVQAAIYNIRQVVSVIEENLPDSKGAHAGGMKALRDLFWEVHSSSNEGFATPSSGDSNNLSFIIRMARMGIARQIGRAVRDFAPNEPSLVDLVRAVVLSSQTQEAERLLRQILDKQDPQLLWSMTDLILKVLDSPDAPKFKQFMHFAASEAGRWFQSSDGVFWSGALIRVGRQAVWEHRDYLQSQPSWLVDGMESESLSRWMRLVYELKDSDQQALMDTLKSVVGRSGIASAALRLIRTIESDPNALELWHKIKEDYHQLDQDPDYRLIGFSDWVPGWIDALSTPSGTEVRHLLSQSIQKGDLNIALRVIQQDPERFDRALRQVIVSLKTGALNDILEMVERGLADRQRH